MAVLGKRLDRHIVIQLGQTPTGADRARLRAGGVELLNYLGGNAFFARRSPGKGTPDLASGPRIVDATEIEPAWKLHRRLAQGDIPEHARIMVPAEKGLRPAAPTDDPEAGAEGIDEGGGTEFAVLYALFHPDVRLVPDASDVVERLGGKVQSLLHSINGAVLFFPTGNITALAGEDIVQWLEPALPPLTPNNDGLRLVTQAGLVQVPPYGLDGSGINVMVYDGGVGYADHPDFGGRLAPRDNAGVTTHATHVAGTIGGNGTLDARYRGMAPAVLLQSYGFQVSGELQAGFLYTDPGDLEQDYVQAMNLHGAIIANNSIGTNTAPNGYDCAWEGDYGVTDMLIDAIVRGSLGAPMRIIWANGNERQWPARCGVGYHTTAPPACAKNHITVGAINSNDETMTSFSSWGPADDGRLKPDICAPGCQAGGDEGVMSTSDSGQYTTLCGTSMAAPAVTGLCALLLQDFVNHYPGDPLPLNSTLKVLLAHNAADLGNFGPDYQFGYGSVRIKDTIDFMRRGSFEEDEIDQSAEKLYFVFMPAGAATLKVTVAWDDPPGSVNTIPELVNDLDVVAISPSGATTFYPWTLDPANPGLAARRNMPDHVNNIEQVVVDAPEAGTWTIRVAGTAVAQGPQVFSIATTPDMQTCSSKGVVVLSADRYACTSTAIVTVNDCDLNSDPDKPETVNATVNSANDPTGEVLTLTETGANSSTFEGTVALSDVDDVGVLRVAEGDTITATYLDADNGQGGSGPVSALATIDCQAPVISGLTVTNLTAQSAVILLNTDEEARVTIRYGVSCQSLSGATSPVYWATSHQVFISGLTRGTTYHYHVEIRDRAGNVSIDDNGGACHSFTTLDVRDYFTQEFTEYDNDVDYRTVFFEPGSPLSYYYACNEVISTLPTDPAGGTLLSLGDDSFQEVMLTGGARFPFFGVDYNTFYVCTNGFVTFTAGDNAYTETLDRHFSLPRISVLFDDLKPGAGTVITWKQLPNRVVVTWENCPEFNTANSNTFQVEMYFSGAIRLAWLNIDAPDGIVGLSDGLGIPADYLRSDMTGFGPCPRPMRAYSPTPANGLRHQPAETFLSWLPGAGATEHAVYFGEAPGALVLQGTSPWTFFDPGLLSRGTTYYWRIDEVNANGTTTGDLWSFSTRSFPDFDKDGDVDQDDFGHLQLCLSGTDKPQEAPECLNAQLDTDSDVDQVDVSLFLGCFGAPQVQASPNCLP